MPTRSPIDVFEVGVETVPMEEDATMADPIVTPQELLGNLLAGQEVDVLHEAALAMLRELMEIEVQGMTGAALGSRSPDRLCMRNGYRERHLATTWRGGG